MTTVFSKVVILLKGRGAEFPKAEAGGGVCWVGDGEVGGAAPLLCDSI
jgi:hypothetical protein